MLTSTQGPEVPTCVLAALTAFPAPTPAADFGFDDHQRDRMLGGAIAAAFYMVGAPAALLFGWQVQGRAAAGLQKACAGGCAGCLGGCAGGCSQLELAGEGGCCLIPAGCRTVSTASACCSRLSCWVRSQAGRTLSTCRVVGSACGKLPIASNLANSSQPLRPRFRRRGPLHADHLCDQLLAAVHAAPADRHRARRCGAAAWRTGGACVATRRSSSIYQDSVKQWDCMFEYGRCILALPLFLLPTQCRWPPPAAAGALPVVFSLLGDLYDTSRRAGVSSMVQASCRVPVSHHALLQLPPRALPVLPLALRSCCR